VSDRTDAPPPAADVGGSPPFVDDGPPSSEMGSWPTRALAAVLILMVRVYQVTLGPFLGGRCRFEPSCSYYFIGAVRKHGPLRGAWRGILRICRCHPFHPGGYDPP